MKTTTPNIAATVGKPVTMTCLAYDDQLVDEMYTFVNWKVNGTEISNTGRIKLTEDFSRKNFGNFTLFIANVTASDAGMYTCEVYFLDEDPLMPVKINLTVKGEAHNVLGVNILILITLTMT